MRWASSAPAVRIRRIDAMIPIFRNGSSVMTSVWRNRMTVLNSSSRIMTSNRSLTSVRAAGRKSLPASVANANQLYAKTSIPRKRKLKPAVI